MGNLGTNLVVDFYHFLFYFFCRPRFWFWEIGNLVFKLCITGVLCVVAQGSPFQVLLALLLCMINSTLLNRFAPYDSDSADALSIACAVCLTMTILGGYVLMANETMKTVNPEVLNYGLIGLNTVPLVLFVVNVVRLKLNHGVGAGKVKVKVKVVSSTAVVPMNELNMNSEVRQWGMADGTKSTKKGGLFLQSNRS